MESIFHALIKHDILISKLNHKPKKLFLQFWTINLFQLCFEYNFLFHFSKHHGLNVRFLVDLWNGFFFSTFQPKSHARLYVRGNKMRKTTNHILTTKFDGNKIIFVIQESLTTKKLEFFYFDVEIIIMNI